MKTDYIYCRLDIVGPEYRNVIFGGLIHIRSLKIIFLIWIILVIPILWSLVIHFLRIFTSFEFIHVLHKISNTIFLFLCLGSTSKLTEIQQDHLKNDFYCNHSDTFLDTPNPLTDQLV